MRFLIPVILTLIGVGAGLGAGLFLRPDPAQENAAQGDTSHDATAGEPVACVPVEGHAPLPPIDAADLADREYVKMNNQFVIPVITETRVASLVVLSITLEAKAGSSELVYQREPKLRDLFLQTLFDQASLGRFSGDFANAANLAPLRDELRTVARRVLGDAVSDVLITDMSRQDA
ncbi:flagellar basal body-associated FliL family protein [Mesobacterium sp. TK19101]|uniref:Flagellar protein FliL n=1 Tax=Mesobacterium hydrothermale TaxID=3111907 RepID=A0ABU6HIA0_9RHOB|nr:flagellar basal body-associated FliL family protein [Mesobacterium sp. TK19101]MEC3861636.1 flagellar basal body-associated FliL family protein [Mesobacterium sp. TK19101]